MEPEQMILTHFTLITFTKHFLAIIFSKQYLKTSVNEPFYL